MATAIVGGDEDLRRRVLLHRERRPSGWGTLEVGDLNEVLKAAEHWDAVLLVRYPSREAFSAMVADPEYQQVTGLRTRALTEAVLQATRPW